MGNHQQEGTMRFEIKAASGGYRGYIVAGNNEIVFWTEVYTSKAGARHACQLVKDHAAGMPIYE